MKVYVSDALKSVCLQQDTYFM